jgi:hypothetical protein
MTTIVNITDTQIEQLKRAAAERGDFEQVALCLRALGINSCLPDRSTVTEARAECARVISEAEAARYEQLRVDANADFDSQRMEQASDWRETLTGETITDEQICQFAKEAFRAGDLGAVAVCEVALDAIISDPADQNDDDALTQAIEDAICEHDQESARAEVARMYRDAWAAEQ